jgi:gag-polypeptide of LTR copia-type
MQESQRVREYYTQIVELVNPMRSLGEKELTEQKVVEKLLISLLESFNSIVTAIEESKDLTTLPIQQLISSFEAHEERKLLRN